MEPGLSPGTVVDGKYQILRLIGRGGMGAVYEGENVRIGRRVAIKVLHEAVAKDKRLVDRFEREARAVGRIGSHHVADVLDSGQLDDGTSFMVMEYLKGQSLAERLSVQGTLATADVIAIAAQLLDGLAMTHEAGIVHRDLKPANIFLAESPSGDFVKILDFGICKFHAAGEAQWTTAGSTVLGTPGYISPEQLTRDEAGPVVDLYAVGVVIYRCIAGRLPYDAETKAELLFHIRDGLRLPILDVAPDLDPELAALVMKGIAPDPAARFASAKEHRAALLAWAKSAEDRELLLAEFLGRPKIASLVPPTATQPPRFRPDAIGAIDAIPASAPAGAESPLTSAATPPSSARELQRGHEDAASSFVDGSPPRERADAAAESEPLSQDAAGSLPPPSKIRAIAVGAAVGVASAVALYEAFR